MQMGHKKKGAIVSGRRGLRQMPAFNFEPRFADMVESGQKTQTIRNTLRSKLGDTVHLYTGHGTKNCRKLGEGRIVSIDRISTIWGLLFINNIMLAREHHDAFAVREGFADGDEMFDWFETVYGVSSDWFKDRNGLPFDGFLYKWVKTD